MSTHSARRTASALGTVAVAAALLAACGSSSHASAKGATSTTKASTSSSKGSGGVVTLSTGSSALFTDNFNPWSPNVQSGAIGEIYEPLFYFDTVKSGQVSPWLATSYAWSNGGKTVTFQLRHGVKWSNGTPFTSADVAFTLGLEMKNKALNSFSLPYKSVTTSGPYTVTVNFTQPAYEDLIYLAGKTVIVPKSLWSSVSNPQTYANPHPIGTGAFVLSRFSPQAMTFDANPHYYMSGMPRIKALRFIAFTGNTSVDPAIEAGQLDWASAYIPDINKAYVSRSPNNKLVDIPLSVTVLEANDVSGPTSSLVVRQAISDAINRKFVGQSVYNGYALKTNPEMLLLPNFSKYKDPALASASLAYSPSAAEKLLESAGYKKGSNGIFVSPSGAPLDITAQVVAGYTDYISALQIIAQELKAAGINLTVDAVSYSEYVANQNAGRFQLIMNNFGYTPSLYAFYYSTFDSQLSAPLGSPASGDYGRFHSSQMDSLLAQAASLQSSSARAPLYDKVQQIVAKNMPYIPLYDQSNDTEFNAGAVTGYPTLSNPYAMPDSWGAPDAAWVALHLKPVK